MHLSVNPMYGNKLKEYSEENKKKLKNLMSNGKFHFIVLIEEVVVICWGDN